VELDTLNICVLHVGCYLRINLLGREQDEQSNLVDTLHLLDNLKVRFDSGYTIEVGDSTDIPESTTLYDCLSGYLPDLAGDNTVYSSQDTSSSSKNKGSSKKGKKVPLNLRKL